MLWKRIVKRVLPPILLDLYRKRFAKRFRSPSIPPACPGMSGKVCTRISARYLPRVTASLVTTGFWNHAITSKAFVMSEKDAEWSPTTDKAGDFSYPS